LREPNRIGQDENSAPEKPIEKTSGGLGILLRKEVAAAYGGAFDISAPQSPEGKRTTLVGIPVL
jgi:hypothetical protein